MALASSTVIPSRFRIKLSKSSPCQLCSQCVLRYHNNGAPATRYVKLQMMAKFSEPHSASMQLSTIRKKLREDVPGLIKKFPWKKAEDLMLQQLLLLGQKTLKWSLLTFFIFSFVSDVMLSVSRNRELMIPLGLFAGCMTADFLKEVCQELLHKAEERALRWQLLGIGGFFTILKLMASYFVVRGQIFLLHVANGGLMQVLWLWKSSLEETGGDDTENSVFNHDGASVAAHLDN